jgi:hypothetical protein
VVGKASTAKVTRVSRTTVTVTVGRNALALLQSSGCILSSLVGARG